MPKSALKTINTEDLIYKIISDEVLNTQIAAIWIKGRFLSSRAQNFLDLFNEK